MKRWSKEEIQRIKGWRLAGFTYKDIAEMISPDVRPDDIRYLIKSRRIISKAIAKKLAVTNSVAGKEAKRRERFRRLIKDFASSWECGWLVGFCNVSGRWRSQRELYIDTRRPELAAMFARAVRRFSKNKVVVRRVDFWGTRYTRVGVYDKVLARFVNHVGNLFCRRWRGRHIAERREGFYRGILAGVFDARGSVNASVGRVKAMRLYLARMPAGAAHNIRIALARLGIKYSMQGKLSAGERKFFQKATAKLNRIALEGASPSVTDKLAKRVFQKDYEKRRSRFFHTAALEIKNTPANLERFSKIVNSRRGDLKRKLKALISAL